jgi:pentatricopeptide repeat protein
VFKPDQALYNAILILAVKARRLDEALDFYQEVHDKAKHAAHPVSLMFLFRLSTSDARGRIRALSCILPECHIRLREGLGIVGADYKERHAVFEICIDFCALHLRC